MNRMERVGRWLELKEAGLDENHATNHAFEQDPSPLKVNLGRGVYKDDNGKDFVLQCVRKAEERILTDKKSNHAYLPFSGLKDFQKVTAELAFGKDSVHLSTGLIATVQTVSGTGALRVGAEFLARNLIRKPVVYLPDPTYVNHYAVFRAAGFELRKYRYYNPSTNGLDVRGMLDDLRDASSDSVVLFHASAHNPTGVDPSLEQWRQISKVCKSKGHLCFFDSAYQGFASGDPDRDAASYRHFLDEGHPILVAQSYAKNFGLYGQRIGALNFITESITETNKALQQLNQVIRPMYSNPPLHGARIVATVLKDPELTALWSQEVKSMADRIAAMRSSLVANLAALGSTRSWRHITDQIGMFAYSGLTREEVAGLRDLHVYCNFDGRMSITGINTKNVEYLAKCIHQVTSKKK
jgi:aspartate aminotransferase